MIAVEEEAGTMAVADPAGAVLGRVTIGERPHEVEVSPDRGRAYVTQFGIADYDNRIGTPGDRIVEIDLATLDIAGAFELPGDVRAPHGVKLRPPAFAELYANAEVGGDTMLVYDVASRRLLRRFPLPAGTHNFVFSSDGASIFAFAGANGVYRLDAENGWILANLDPGSPVRGLAISTDGNVLAGARGEIVELDPTDLHVLRRMSAPRLGQYVYLDELPDGTIVAPSLADGGVAIFPGDGGQPRFVETGRTPIVARRGPDGLVYVANVRDDHVTVLDNAGEPLGAITGLTSPNGLGFGDCPAR